MTIALPTKTQLHGLLKYTGLSTVDTLYATVSHLRVAVHHDPEVDVYWATSTDLRGLVVEAKTMDALVNEVQCGIDTLLEDMFPSSAPIQPVTDLRIDRSVCAA